MIPSVMLQLRLLQKHYVTVNIPWVETCRPEKEREREKKEEVTLTSTRHGNDGGYDFISLC